jgi:hypothetical protein
LERKLHDLASPAVPDYGLPFRRGTRPIEGEILWAEIARDPFPRQRGFTRLQKEGLAYEQKVVRAFRRWFRGERLLPGPWISYEDAEGCFGARPDLVILSASIIVEAKLSRCAEAEAQLAKYQQLGDAVWGRREWRLIAVCKKWKGSVPPDIGRAQEATPGLNWMLWP